MEQNKNTYDELVSVNEELRIQLEEANDNIQAIRMGQVDALVVNDGAGHQLYTLKTADQTYRVFIEKMNEGAVTLNPEGVILYSNSRFAAMLNLSLEKVMGTSFDTFIPYEHKNKYSDLINNGWEEDCKDEICLLTSYDVEIPCLLSCNKLDLDEGPTLSLIITDLTIQKHVEKRLKDQNDLLESAQNATRKLNDELEELVKARTDELLISREHFRLLANNIPQMTWTNLPNGDTNFYNQQWYDYTLLKDISTKELAWQAVIHPDDFENTITKYNSALASGEVFEIENRYKDGKTGNYRWHLNRAIPLRNDNGEIILWIGTATDIEEQKQQMQRKDEFIGIASHELKTPLTSLKGYLQLMATYKKEDVPVIIKNYIGKANIAINKLQQLINDLLDVSKIQAGRLEYRMDKIELSELMASWIENAEHIYPNYQFNNQAEGNFMIMGNAERLEQVVMNFINNAVKYSPDSNRIVIKTEKLESVVRISVF